MNPSKGSDDMSITYYWAWTRIQQVPMEYSLKLTMCQAAFDTSSLFPRSNVKQLLATKYSSNRTSCKRAIPQFTKELFQAEIVRE